MPTLENALRTAACNALTNTFIASATCSTLVLESAGASAVAVLVFSSSAWGAAANGVSTAAAITSDAAAIGGVATSVVMYNSTGTKLMTCTLGTSAATADFTISNTTIGSSESVTCSAIVMTVPAS